MIQQTLWNGKKKAVSIKVNYRKKGSWAHALIIWGSMPKLNYSWMDWLTNSLAKRLQRGNNNNSKRRMRKTNSETHSMSTNILQILILSSTICSKKKTQNWLKRWASWSLMMTNPQPSAINKREKMGKNKIIWKAR